MLEALSPVKSLSSRLILFVLVLLCLAMGGLTAINNGIAGENLYDIARQRIHAQSKGSAEQIEAYFAERKSDLTVVSSLEAVRGLLAERRNAATTEDAAAVLVSVQAAYGYDSMSVLDTEGTIILSTNEAIVGETLAASPYIQQAFQGEISISEVGVDDEGVALYIAAPVFSSQGNIIGALDVRASLERINTIVGNDTNSTGEGSYSVLLDDDLIRISNPIDPNLLFVPVIPLSAAEAQEMIEQQRFGPQTANYLSRATNLTEVKEAVDKLRVRKASEGSDIHEFFSGLAATTEQQTESVAQALDSMPWFYIHRVPNETFNSPVVQQTWSSVGVTVGIALFAIMFMFFFVRYFFKQPMDKVVLAAQDLERGNLNRRLHIQSKDELGKLASSLNTMAESLETRIATEQNAREEARKLQEAERQGREVLEQAVNNYLYFMQEVARGDLTRRVEVEHNGALGALGTGMNAMVSNLHDITRQVQQASSNIAAAAAEILAATTQQASSAAEQSSAVTQTSTTIEEIKVITHQTAQQAAQVSQDGQSALHIARQGTQSVEETISSMNQIRQRVESIAQTILSLSEQTQAIGAITTTVSELSDQSNLLALNAAIEAARAGEQGRSFAVVAQHVRDLAERSKAATVQVREILEEIQRATNAAVLVTEEGSKRVEAGTQLAMSAGEVIHRIASEVESGAQSNMQIVAAAHQQTAGMEQIGQAMQAIQQSTTQVLASTRQAERAAQDLHTLAQTLNQTVDAYRL